MKAIGFIIGLFLWIFIITAVIAILTIGYNEEIEESVGGFKYLSQFTVVGYIGYKAYDICDKYWNWFINNLKN